MTTGRDTLLGAVQEMHKLIHELAAANGAPDEGQTSAATPSPASSTPQPSYVVSHQCSGVPLRVVRPAAGSCRVFPDQPIRWRNLFVGVTAGDVVQRLELVVLDIIANRLPATRPQAAAASELLRRADAHPERIAKVLARGARRG